jgi:hypothetical protein
VAPSGQSTGSGTVGASGAEVVSDAAVEGASLTAPAFGSNVIIFSPSMSMTTIQSQLDTIYAQQLNNQFGTNRYSFLFLPGKYTLDVGVAYYMQVLGLGQSPDDVVITGSVTSTGLNLGGGGGNATLSFWRGAENMAVVPTGPGPDMWAVAQGGTFRRMHVQGALTLADSGTSSGGFLADCKIDGQVSSGSEQQWFSRNSTWGSWNGGVWNMVFVGVPQAPAGAWPGSPYSVLTATPLVQEKPFLFVDSTGDYNVRVPGVLTGSSGTSWSSGTPAGTTIPLSQFYLAQAGSDTAATLNDALGKGLDVIFTPGIYPLEAPLVVSRADTVLLGLGLATLVPSNGTPAIAIADVDGVRMGGLIFDAGPTNSSTLVEIGTAPTSVNHSQDPTVLYDSFCRVGGATPGMASSCVTVNSNDVIGDNLWLWRADHGAGVGWTSNVSPTGLVVNGDRVIMYGLAVEHFQQYQTLWNGNDGQVYFYQSEMPYDPPTQAAWMNGTTNGYASYKVAAAVTTHTGLGLGVYSAFRNDVQADDAFEGPAATGVGMHHLVTVWLDGSMSSSINHVLNATGSAVNPGNRKATLN